MSNLWLEQELNLSLRSKSSPYPSNAVPPIHHPTAYSTTLRDSKAKHLRRVRDEERE